jgi:hypothetical protein
MPVFGWYQRSRSPLLIGPLSLWEKVDKQAAPDRICLMMRFTVSGNGIHRWKNRDPPKAALHPKRNLWFSWLLHYHRFCMPAFVTEAIESSTLINGFISQYRHRWLLFRDSMLQDHWKRNGRTGPESQAEISPNKQTMRWNAGQRSQFLVRVNCAWLTEKLWSVTHTKVDRWGSENRSGFVEGKNI